MGKVSIVKCEDYTYENVEKAIRSALSLIGGLEGKIKKGDKVLLKPNMLMAAKPEEGITTHPSVVRAMVRIVKEYGGQPFIGDSPGTAFAKVDRALEDSGFKEVAEQEGAQILKLAESVQKKDIYIARAVLDMDLIIDLAKLKTHMLTLFTGAIKNMFGVVPGFYKGAFHKDYPNAVDFSAKLVDIFSVKKPLFGIMDGIYGMDGNGPSAGRVRKIGLILASFDCVSLDAVSSKIIGYDPFAIDTTRIAHDRKLGIGDLNDIEVTGEKLDSVVVRDFRQINSVNAMLKNIPEFMIPVLRWFARKLVRVYPVIKRKECIGCGVCVKSCPVKAIKLDNKNKAMIDYDKCISCYCCHELCPEKAIKIGRSILAKIMGIGSGNFKN